MLATLLMPKSSIQKETELGVPGVLVRAALGQASSGLAPGAFSAVSWHTACPRRSATHRQSCGRRGADGTHLPGGRTGSHALTRLPGCRQFTAKHREGKAEGGFLLSCQAQFVLPLSYRWLPS